MVKISVVLMAFNLIPLPPLDGHHVLYHFLPPGGQRVMEQIGPYGILIIIFVARPILAHIVPPLFDAVMGLAFLGLP